MVAIIFWSAVIVLSLMILIKAADVFTTYSEKIGFAFGISSFIIGATIVAIGTSLPELVSSVYAVADAGVPEYVLDTVVGSNISNALLILGIGAIVARTLKVDTSLIDVDLPFFFISTALFLFFLSDQTITVIEGAFLVGFFIIFIIYSTRSKAEPRDRDEMAGLEEQYEKRPWWKKISDSQIITYFIIIVISGAAVAFSAKFLIDSILALSETLNISSSMLTITVVGFGTSLPEVLTAIAAIRVGNHGMAIGNVLGSNTFNVLLITGVPALISPLPVAEGTLAIGIPFLILATLVVIFVTLDNKVRIWEGVALLFLYVVFIGKITALL